MLSTGKGSRRRTGRDDPDAGTHEPLAMNAGTGGRRDRGSESPLPLPGPLRTYHGLVVIIDHEGERGEGRMGPKRSKRGLV